MDGDAILSACGTYRYALTRVVGPQGGIACFVMHNPSTADALTDDPTIRRCMGYARTWGYGTLVVVNRFALRATDPRAVFAAADPVGPDNDAWLAEMFGLAQSGIVVAAWGNDSAPKTKVPLVVERTARVRDLARTARVDLHVLDLSQAGTPKHPLYLRGDLVPTKWA